MNTNKFALLAQVLLLSLPIFFLSKWLQKKIQPKAGFKNFLLWVLLVLIASILWFAIAMFFYTKFFFPNHK
ncbi:MAG: hypothetical protein V9E96_07145 [Chitinophagaceae bacterium]|jgi:hypothetical protein